MPPSLNEIVPILDYSDGDPSKWPSASSPLHPVDAERVEKYRMTMGNKWMNERKEAQAGRSYTIERLPTGYKLFGRPREHEPSHVDTYLYGHPSGYGFRSCPEFYDHFVRLMNQGDSNGCKCKACYRPARRSSQGVTKQAASKTNQSASSSSTVIESKPRPHLSEVVRPGVLPPPPHYQPPKEDLSEVVDEEGTPDIWRKLALDLKKEGSLDTPIEEPSSIDWCLEQRPLPAHIRKMQKQPLWMPRTGELVLFLRKLSSSQTLQFNRDDGTFKLWDGELDDWVAGEPIWEAGIVTETSEEEASIKDLAFEKDKDYQVSYSGLRIEPMPEIGNMEKPWSKRSTYVPLHQVRPFVFWQEYLKGTDRSAYHPTVRHALVAQSSFSVLNKFHFKGTYPTATVFCKGVYIGAELLLVGDVVRIAPWPDAGQITDVMKITAIKLKMFNIGASESLLELRSSEVSAGEEDRDAPPWYTCLHISGVAYTTDPTKAYGMGKLPLTAKSGLPEGLGKYGSWYNYQDPSKRLEVPFQRIIGRCYEDEAMMQWFPPRFNSTQDRIAVASFSAINKMPKGQMGERLVDLSVGLEGTMQGRAHGSANDKRIAVGEGKTWYFGDSRVDQLELHEIKNMDVGAHATFGGEVSNCPRQALHLEAMKRGQKAREKGYKGWVRPVASRHENMGGLAASALVAGGLNAVRSDKQGGRDEDDNDDDEDDDDEGNGEDEGGNGEDEGGMEAGFGHKRKRDVDQVSEVEMDVTGGENGGMRFRDLDLKSPEVGAIDDDEQVAADKLIDELAEDVMQVDSGSRAKRQRTVIEID